MRLPDAYVCLILIHYRVLCVSVLFWRDDVHKHDKIAFVSLSDDANATVVTVVVMTLFLFM